MVHAIRSGLCDTWVPQPRDQQSSQRASAHGPLIAYALGENKANLLKFLRGV
jgi:hypothetical protein